MRRRSAFVAMAAALAPAAAPRPALDQTWPTRPIRLILPYPPGGGTDTLARPWAERMRLKLGQPLVIENRGGGATNIGMEIAARTAPDGHSLIINTDNVALFPHLYQRLGYDLFRDFAAVSYLAASPLVLAANPAVPAATLQDVVALLRREPDQWVFANPSIGSPHHLGFELLAREAGLRMVQAEYRGGGPALAEVLAGHVHLGCFTLGAVNPHIQAGRLRAYAVLQPARSAAAPRIPTTAEAGYPAVVNSLRFVLLAPAGTPAQIVRRLHAATSEAMAEPALRGQLARAGFDVMTGTPEEATALLREEKARWAPILPGLNLRLD
ncbi:tripartite tricarboxylate transporter substrate binding protein [Roseococcus sp. SYP-B2431]|uniref:Bug family tripartite tricarboxylate transporter substrate binding protein n=1 Tax=Roseococcus sp. SYP-B2431 TaxID=2496640 RepID=UPI00103ABCB4|nr:tripartite tricarboxylate transporter substrate-binding protein [Roseococcus sp. SYP-B2431]TCH98031.1 tripartite tricarboxylate transporter substrate binding protein [Roseococcus sp. SYP-B2431]